MKKIIVMLGFFLTIFSLSAKEKTIDESKMLNVLIKKYHVESECSLVGTYGCFEIPALKGLSSNLYYNGAYSNSSGKTGNKISYFSDNLKKDNDEKIELLDKKELFCRKQYMDTKIESNKKYLVKADIIFGTNNSNIRCNIEIPELPNYYSLRDEYVKLYDIKDKEFSNNVWKQDLISVKNFINYVNSPDEKTIQVVIDDEKKEISTLETCFYYDNSELLDEIINKSKIKDNEYLANCWNYIINYNSLKCYEYLLKKNNNLYKEGNAYYQSLKFNKSEWTNKILKAGYIITTYDLLQAIKENNIEAINVILDADLDLSKDFPRILVSAVESENFELVKILVKQGYDITESYDRYVNENNQTVHKKETAFEKAVEKNNVEIASYLLKKGSKISGKSIVQAIENDNNDMLILIGEENLKEEVYSEYIGKYDSINAFEFISKLQNEFDYYTCLKSAVENGSLKIIPLLLDNNDYLLKTKHYELGDGEKGSDTSCTSILGIAVFNNQIEAIKILLQYGADINQKLIDYDEPIYDIRTWEVARYERRVHECDYTALALACKTGNEEAIKVLIENGADIELECKNGSPINLCKDAKTRKFLIKFID